MSVGKIAFRNLSRQKRRTFLLGGAIAFGVMIITFVNGISGGLLSNAQNNFAKIISGHIFALQVDFTKNNRMIYEIKNSKAFEEAAAELDKTYKIKYRQSRTSVFNMANIIFQNNSVLRQIDGVNWEKDQFLSDNLVLVQGSLDKVKNGQGIVIGEKTAKKLKVELGELVILQAETIFGQQNVIEVPVEAIYQEDNLSGGLCYMEQESINELLNMPKGSSNWQILFLDNFSEIEPATLLYSQILEKKEVRLYPREKTVGKGFQTIFGDLRKDKDKTTKTIVANLNDQISILIGFFGIVQAIVFSFLIVLMLVIMVGLNNTYRIIVWERNREIGTMRALGMQRGSVTAMFLTEAFYLAMFGVVVGIVASIGLLSLVSLIDFTPKTGGNDFGLFLNQNHMTWTLDIALLVVTLILVALLTLIAAASPARKAGRVDPAVALRATA